MVRLPPIPTASQSDFHLRADDEEQTSGSTPLAADAAALCPEHVLARGVSRVIEEDLEVLRQAGEPASAPMLVALSAHRTATVSSALVKSTPGPGSAGLRCFVAPFASMSSTRHRVPLAEKFSATVSSVLRRQYSETTRRVTGCDPAARTDRARAHAPV